MVVPGRHHTLVAWPPARARPWRPSRPTWPAIEPIALATAARPRARPSGARRHAEAAPRRWGAVTVAVALAKAASGRTAPRALTRRA